MPEFVTPSPAGYIGLPVTNILFFTMTLSPALVGANTSAEQQFVLPVSQIPANPAAGSVVLVTKPTAQVGLGIVGARIPAANTVAITFMNATGVGITPTAGEVYTFFVVQ